MGEHYDNFRRATFGQKMTISLILAVGAYAIPSIIIYSTLLAYAFITGAEVIVMARAIMDIPAQLSIVTFIVGVSVTLIDEFMYRDETTEKDKQE